MRFGYHLLAWRRHQNLSQVQLAEKSGVLRPYLSRLERDDADPSLALVCRLATALGLSAGRLIDVLPAPRIFGKKKMDDLTRRFVERDRRVRVGEHALRKIRVQLGEEQWKAFLRRVDKHKAYED